MECHVATLDRSQATDRDELPAASQQGCVADSR